jgi:G:T-mismatch repair DNA endonuclease (very short patch repair protein)
MPKTHKVFWSKKFAANVARDKRKRAELKKLGIKSVVFWECQIKKNAPKLVARLSKVLSSRKMASERSAA